MTFKNIVQVIFVHGLPTFVWTAPIIAFPYPCRESTIQIKGIIIGEQQIMSTFDECFNLFILKVEWDFPDVRNRKSADSTHRRICPNLNGVVLWNALRDEFLMS